MAFSCRLFFLLSILSLLLLIASAATTSLKLRLYPSNPHHIDGQIPPPDDPFQILRGIAAASLARALDLKNPKTKSDAANTAAAVKVPLFPRSYGGYSVSLSFGTPPQTVPFVFDTGSSLVWLPCTSRYLCSQCEFSGIDPKSIPLFIPKNSSSSRLIGCKNPKCQWVLGPNVRCGNNKTETCPPYVIQYGLGSTVGILLSDTLNLPENQTVPDFLVGCSVISNRQPAGIAGFGRGTESLPSQMGLKKFSHCLVSRRYDDSSVSSELVLETGSGRSSGSKIRGLSYTPFHKNPNVSISAFQEYYYVNLRRIVVGNKRVKIPYKFLESGPDGNGGSIVDSGSTFTFMQRSVFDLVAKEFETQMANYSRATDIEALVGLRPCFKISDGETVTVPELVLEFKGGAKMELPLANYFSFVETKEIICLTVVSDTAVALNGGGRGPAIILGSFQQQNFHVEYDLEKERFGFVKKRCT